MNPGGQAVPQTILVAARSAPLRHTLRRLLVAAQYAVLEAGDSQETLAQLNGNPGVSLLVAELHLGLLDGLQLTHQVRAMPAFRFLPVLVVSADGAPAQEAEGLAAGVTGWLSQPVQAEQLLKVVDRLLF